ncbi:conserved hypothetical protein [Brucella neotomae 5K33]|uniref:Uncharacterized protein n=1 Tax=Brucella neotomae 5K33 TaxID=520456 RepID=A0A7U8KBJ2_BRUNE|nr:conserved hypothetical protein [Brucella neotomae 5K33]
MAQTIDLFQMPRLEELAISNLYRQPAQARPAPHVPNWSARTHVAQRITIECNLTHTLALARVLFEKKYDCRGSHCDHHG